MLVVQERNEVLAIAISSTGYAFASKAHDVDVAELQKCGQVISPLGCTQHYSWLHKIGAAITCTTDRHLFVHAPCCFTRLPLGLAVN